MVRLRLGFTLPADDRSWPSRADAERLVWTVARVSNGSIADLTNDSDRPQTVGRPRVTKLPLGPERLARTDVWRRKSEVRKRRGEFGAEHGRSAARRHFEGAVAA